MKPEVSQGEEVGVGSSGEGGYQEHELRELGEVEMVLVRGEEV